MPFNSVQIVITPGTAKPIIPAFNPVLTRCIRITMLHAANCEVAYLLNGPTGAVLVKSAQNLVTEIAPASATAPGTMLVLQRYSGQAAPYNLAEFQIDGAHADTICVSWELDA